MPRIWQAALAVGVAAVLSAGLVLVIPEPPIRVVGSIFVTTLVFLFLMPDVRGVSAHLWAPFAGAVATIVVPHVLNGFAPMSLPEMDGAILRQELVSNFDVPILILSLAYMSISLDSSGFFNWCSLQIIRSGRGNGRHLLLNLFLGISVLTYLTSNDIVILSMTPILVYLGRNARIKNLTPYLITQFIAANTASMALYIGNPTNIVIGRTVGMGFVEYARRMAIPGLVACAVTLLLCMALFGSWSRRNRIPKTYAVPKTAFEARWSREMTVKLMTFGACLFVLGSIANPWSVEWLWGVTDPIVNGQRVSQVIVITSVLFALFMLGYDLVQDMFRDARQVGRLFKERMARVPFEIVVFFLSFCVILKGLEDAGLVAWASRGIVDAFAQGPAYGGIVSAFSGVAAVNLMNNIPATILFQKAWAGGLGQTLAAMHPTYADIFVEVSLYASNFGANLTFIGALAGLMWLRILKDSTRGHESEVTVPTKREFMVYGLVFVPAVTVVTAFTIAWVRIMFG